MKYIDSVVGEPPKKPSKWAIGKNKKYEEAVQKYSDAIKDAEKEYEAEYLETRKGLEERDKKEYKERLDLAAEKIKKSKAELDKAEKEISENEFLGPDLKEINAVNTLYNYIINNRAETIKEAVQLYFEEKRIEETQKKDEEFREQVLKLIDGSVEQITQNLTKKFDRMTNDVIREIDSSVQSINNGIDDVCFWIINNSGWQR